MSKWSCHPKWLTLGKEGSPSPEALPVSPATTLGTAKLPPVSSVRARYPNTTFCLARQNLVSRQDFGTVLVGVGAPPFAKVADDGFDGDPVSLNTLSFQDVT